ncbi:MAG: phenylacetic acid degradation protein PaaY [Oceanospirillaceae bacterium]|uniref:phenylacetic acid degradation protein PaaY n=1 Tax=unclassified Thalassolituus TaxID=2624967 RepID=UPI000C09C9D0|nr:MULTISPECIES: phenylacetic acid degradation protein PaaY [unclassified Thalassolituus]MAK91593.1 phenylacetic acid degradation protein PaaY [Thalassolituus sp.]MAS25825.1 phenylacetic acid degradation protein PaaY [Oceanospirillaceae bacterium]MAY00117.1 phenylacetic acid degradation protein PaaY [Oceanospirillaceae bacterium]MBL35722.1 phenylacetic acid degradation protein PaaY [Oceanospirillaceae bacterium]MBS51504.1 phenylacetic acid degradation protein PaaY [Oceanospirillaceae bacterium|tara:strand:+ start:4819 stop:5415 length:597 start_codon:yes stop_codon:yes gene_type:complete
MPCYRIDGVTPVVHPTAYVHPTAVLIGDVIIGPGCYVGPCASLRGDFGQIVMEEESNMQDNCTVHGFPDTVTRIKRHGHIGHGAILHGCVIGEDTLVGMNAVIMDFADIGAESIVAAASFVKTRFECPPRSMVMGAPADVKRQVSDKELAWKQNATRQYIDLTKRSIRSMVECTPLTEVEENRPRPQTGEHAPLNKEG